MHHSPCHWSHPMRPSIRRRRCSALELEVQVACIGGRGV
ncbi:hypothetical protein CKAH01_05311 [Colletotrichum kahawae]|uniref:Uncharacterized protein n=1 Tax=Colletotrichum kahawae TaxID=34407 RepID=A0AAD9YFR6_COLKA|nr:hypothetical protein CKAH01_05311 [Colletotrichum kahawae]